MPKFNPTTLSVSKFCSKPPVYLPELGDRANCGSLKRSYSSTRLDLSPPMMEPAHFSSTCSSPWRLSDAQATEYPQEGFTYPHHSVHPQPQTDHVIHYRAEAGAGNVSSSSSPSQQYHHFQHQRPYNRWASNEGGHSNPCRWTPDEISQDTKKYYVGFDAILLIKLFACINKTMLLWQILPSKFVFEIVFF